MDAGGFDSWCLPLVGPEENVDGSLSNVVGRSAFHQRRSHTVSLYHVCSLHWFFGIDIVFVRSAGVSWDDELTPTARRFLPRSL